MDEIEQRFQRWVGWIQGDLLLQVQNIVLDDYMFGCFEESLKPYTGKAAESEIITWIAKNHVGNICLAIRRFDDRDRRTVSLRRLLVEMRVSADIITEENLEKYCGIKCGPEPNRPNVRRAIEDDLLSLDKYGGQIRDFVNTIVAHFDANPGAVPTFGILRQAIDCYHTIFRKWAYVLTGMSFQPDLPNPMDLVPMVEEDYVSQFSVLWRHLFDDAEGK
jgi:hypothetical protein